MSARASPLPQAGGAARLGSLLPSRSGVGLTAQRSVPLRAPTSNPSRKREWRNKWT